MFIYLLKNFYIEFKNMILMILLMIIHIFLNGCSKKDFILNIKDKDFKLMIENKYFKENPCFKIEEINYHDYYIIYF